MRHEGLVPDPCRFAVQFRVEFALVTPSRVTGQRAN